MKHLFTLVFGLFLILLVSCNNKEETGDSSSLEVKTYACTDITENSAVCNGEVIAESTTKITSRGFCWGSSPSPKYSDNHFEAGKGLGLFSETLQGISPNRTYYVRAFASTAAGIVYGNDVTLQLGIFPPTVQTGSVFNIKEHSAVCTGMLMSSGGGNVSSFGVCWSKNEHPTIDQEKKETTTNDGSIEVEISGLEPGTTYYVKAFATNEAGTSYGEQVSFTAESNAEITVKDKQLQSVLIELFDKNKDGIVRKDEAESADVLNASARGISTIEGLESYCNLTIINLSDNQLTSADFSAFKALKILNVSDNSNLSNVTVNNCTSLEYYYGQHTSVSRLFFKDLNKLREVYAFEGFANLQDINVDGCVELEHLEIRDTPNTFTELTFSNLPELRNLYIGGEAFEHVTTLSINLPKLENINLNCWRGLKTLEISNCTKLKTFVACQLYAMQSLDLSSCQDLEYVYIPDATTLGTLVINNANLQVLDAWNLYQMKTCTLDAPILKSANLSTAERMQELSLNTPNLKYLNINAAHELKALDISSCTSLTNLQACQLYKISEFDSSPCHSLDTLYLPDATSLKSAKLLNPNLSRAELFGSQKGLETLTMDCPKLTYLRLDACQSLKSLDLSSCINLTRLEACQLYSVTSLDLSMCTKLRYVYIPDATAATDIIIGNSPDLSTILCWNCAMPTLDLSKCATTILELNAGSDGAGACPNLETIWLRREQTITVCNKPGATEFQYID